MPVKTQGVSTTNLSVIYDRIYDIADRLFKKYNPCNIHKKGNNVTCIGKTAPCKTLCCYECSSFCGLSTHYYWDNGCTIKCLGCKLFLCFPARDKHPIFSKKLYRLRTIAYLNNLPATKYYLPKEKWLKELEKNNGNTRTLQSFKSRRTQKEKEG